MQSTNKMPINTANSDSLAEPMDIDMSAHSVSAMDISYNEDSDELKKYISFKDEDCENFAGNKNKHCEAPVSPAKHITSSTPIAMEHIPKAIKTYYIKKRLDKKFSATKEIWIRLLGLVVIFVAFLLYQFTNLDCNENIDIDSLKHNLSEKLFGQELAVKEILTNLQKEVKTKILFLYGGTGVGKTYAVSMILNNLNHYINVYHFIEPRNMFSSELLIGLTMCAKSLFVLDNYNNRHDMEVKQEIRQLIEKSERLGKVLTIILVLNCETIDTGFVKNCDDSFLKDLKERFDDINVFKSFIRFEQLTKKHLRQCIENEVRVQKLENVDIEKISSIFNVAADGCKGVYSKVRHLHFT